MPVQKGNTVKIDYVGTLDDGTEFDNSSKHGAPLEFEVGSGQVIQGFDDAVLGMKPGEEKKFHLTPANAYGESNEQLIKKIPRSGISLPKVEAGMMLMASLPNGQQVPVKVIAATEEEVILDLNHPLAGKALNFKIKLLEIVEA